MPSRVRGAVGLNCLLLVAGFDAETKMVLVIGDNKSKKRTS
jgi:hypothetical protein